MKNKMFWRHTGCYAIYVRFSCWILKVHAMHDGKLQRITFLNCLFTWKTEKYIQPTHLYLHCRRCQSEVYQNIRPLLEAVLFASSFSKCIYLNWKKCFVKEMFQKGLEKIIIFQWIVKFQTTNRSWEYIFGSRYRFQTIHVSVFHC